MLLTAQPIKAQTPDIPVTVISAVHETPKGTLERLATQIALADGLNPYLFSLIVTKESQWNPNAVSKTHDYGLVQIHLAAHPDISKTQAFDPVFSLEWMGKQWQEGHEDEWSTYREYMGIE